MRTKQDYQKAFMLIEGIYTSANHAEAMTTDELVTAVMELQLEGGEHIASVESAVKGEACHRLRHPFTWRFRRWFKQTK